MAFGIQFKGMNDEYVIGLGDNMQFHAKVTSRNLVINYAPPIVTTTSGSSTPLQVNRYSIPVPAGKIPLVFIHSPNGVPWAPIILRKLSSTAWEILIHCPVFPSTNDLELYVFVGRDSHANDGWGIEVYNEAGAASWNTSGPLPLLFKNYIEADIAGRQFGVDAWNAKVHYEPFGAGITWAESGVSKPAYACISSGYGKMRDYDAYPSTPVFAIIRDHYTLTSTGIRIGMERMCNWYDASGSVKVTQLVPQIIPIIDGAFYD